MNKSELVAKVAEKTGMNKIAAKEAVDAVFESLKDGLKKENDKFTQLGFGTFKVEKRKARTAKNPARPSSNKRSFCPHHQAARHHPCREAFGFPRAAKLPPLACGHKCPFVWVTNYHELVHKLAIDLLLGRTYSKMCILVCDDTSRRDASARN